MRLLPMRRQSVPRMPTQRERERRAFAVMMVIGIFGVVAAVFIGAQAGGATF